MMRDSPSKASNDTRCSAATPLKSTVTSSNRRTGSEVTAIRGARLRCIDEDLRDEVSEDENQHRGGYHGLGGCTAHALRASARTQSIKTTDQSDHESEHERLE